jgi:hypothetical protein
MAFSSGSARDGGRGPRLEASTEREVQIDSLNELLARHAQARRA